MSRLISPMIQPFDDDDDFIRGTFFPHTHKSAPDCALPIIHSSHSYIGGVHDCACASDCARITHDLS